MVFEDELYGEGPPTRSHTLPFIHRASCMQRAFLQRRASCQAWDNEMTPALTDQIISW